MGYWRTVAAAATKAALKSIKVETPEAAMVLFIGQAIIAGIIWALSGSLDLWPRAATVAAPFLLFAPLWLVHFIQQPPRMAAEATAKLNAAEAEIGLIRQVPDLVKIKGLVRRHARNLYDLRKANGGTDMARAAAYVAQVQADLVAMFGLEYADGYGGWFRRILNEGTHSDRYAALKELEQQLSVATITLDMITRETPDLNGYVSRRLEELRMLA